MIKVALIGTHGTRKSTTCHKLVFELKERRINAGYLGEVAREARLAGFPLNEGTTRDAQEWILYTQIANELKAKAAGDVDILVCDRSVLDNYVYYIDQFGKNPLLDPIVNYWTKTYAHLFKVPINCSDLTDDKVRSTDPIFQRRIDDILERELDKRGVNYHSFRDIESTLDIVLRERK